MVERGEPTSERLAAIQRDARTLADQRSGTTSSVGHNLSSPDEPTALLRVVANITLGSVVLLTLTGVHLFFYYQPVSRLSGESQLAGGTSGVGGLSELSRQLHVLSGWLVGIGVIVWLIGRTLRGRSAFASASLPVGLLVLGAAAVGGQAAWDQVQLAASSSQAPTGFLALFADEVVVIARQGEMVTATHLLGWLALHVSLACVAALIALVAVSRAQRGAT